ncbi:unnamed protein product, partial [Ascophyllum nodosum]
PRICFRCGQPGHFYAGCRAIPPAPLNTHEQQMPTPPAPHGPPASSDSSWSFST